ncbi:MAG: hypothetical protein LBR11_06305 [Deltaproteobacteria bacterium]|nr:hypothetical protein [Deltaproteobacteria bacterium]
MVKPHHWRNQALRDNHFFELNNVLDLTFHDDFASIFDFTLDVFDSIFQERLEQALVELKKSNQLTPEATIVDQWEIILEPCDGLTLADQSRVLSPDSILSFLDRDGVQ